MRKEKVTVSLTRDRLSALDRAARQRRSSRSALIEEALEVWERERLKRELAEGYKAMAAEDRQTAEENLASNVEACG